MLNHCLNSGGSGFYGFFGMFFWIVFIILAIWLGVQLFSKIINTNQFSNNIPVDSSKDPLSILNERFIRGEITEEEYVQKKQLLQK